MKHRIIAVILGGLLILAGCSDILTGPENGKDLQNGSAGNLTVRIGYSLSQGRTASPSHDGNTPLEYTLEFTWAGGGAATPTHDPVSVSPGIPASIRLGAGDWTITARAKADGVEKASGSASVTVTEGGDVAVVIALSPVGGSPATGTLGYTLYFPEGATGSLTLADAGGSSVGSPTGLVSGTEGSITLAPGSYLATVSLSKGGETAGRTEAIHIVAGLATKVAYNFYEDLASAPTPVSSNTDLAKIGVDWPLSGRYALTQNITLNDWMPLGSLTTPFTGSFDGGGNTITIASFATTALTDNQYIGIFAAVKGESAHNKARVKNLTIASSVNISALSTTQGQGIGLVSGYAEDAVISNISLSGNLSIAGVAKIIFAGGAVGDMRKGAELKDCTSAMGLSATKTAAGALNSPPYIGATTAIGGLVGFFLTSADGAEYGEGRDALIKDCVNSGNITVSYLLGQNILVGGIVGGWAASGTVYLGSVEDCAYSGNLSYPQNGTCKSGGIAGAIGGNGGTAENDANTSRILRCRAAGDISNVSSLSSAGIGGIVGEGSNGALVAFSSSDVTITGTTNRGGIVGRLPSAVRISDCWSRVSGVSGSGISNTVRCYAIVDQTELWIAVGSGVISMEGEKPAQWFYEVTHGWDFDKVWIMGEDGYPRLRGVDNR
jgi:hypothetical protein